MIDFNKLVKEFELGQLKQAPKQIARGLLNEVWMLSTDSGDYAVKCLTSNTPRKYSEYQLADQFANDLYQLGIPSVPALKHHQSLFIYPFVRQQTIPITLKAKQVGYCLGEIQR